MKGLELCAKEIGDEFKKTLQTCIQENDRFSLSLDEYISKRNRRYVSISVHARDALV